MTKTLRSVTAGDASAILDHLIDEVAASHQPVVISSERASAVLVSEEDWEAIQETLNLLSIPGMGESIKQGMSEPVGACAKDLEW